MSKTVWVNGAMDVVHIGHIRLLKYAKSLGDILIVGIDSDKRIKTKKGGNRPINNEAHRKEFLESLNMIYLVVVFNTDQDLEQLIKKYSPDFWVMGKEYEGHEIPGTQYAKKIVLFDFIEGLSSTSIIKKVND